MKRELKRVVMLLMALTLFLSACKAKEKLPDEPETPEPQPPSEWVTPPPSPIPTNTPDKTGTPQPPDVYEPAPQDYFRLTDEAFWKRVDGSTATIPISFALFGHFMDDKSNPHEVIYHNRTHEAYENLLNGYADIIFVTEPSREAQRMFDEAGVEIDIVPIVKDAFVLLVNERNPVKDLTQQQLRDIYSGKTSNWKDVGGDDLDIIPYQRGETSGSQTLFLSLLMRDTKPMIAPSEYYYADMGGIIDAVAEYKNGRASIGFSVFYYAYAMYGKDDVRFLKVDGVLPTEESIIAGEYPLESNYYAVIRKDTPIGHPARGLVSWILTDVGQLLMQKTGYVPLRKLAIPYNIDETGPQDYGNYEQELYLYGIGAELGSKSGEFDYFGAPKKLDSGFYYTHPYTSSDKVNALLDAFIKNTLEQEGFKERMAESIHKYGVPFRQHTLQWGRFLTCLVYFGEERSFFLYGEVWGSFEPYVSICIDTEKGEVVDPSVVIDALLELEHMEGAKTVYERVGDSWSYKTEHIPSDEHVVTALWVHSEQAIIIEVMDQGVSYRYDICTNDYGGYAGQ